MASKKETIWEILPTSSKVNFVLGCVVLFIGGVLVGSMF